ARPFRCDQLDVALHRNAPLRSHRVNDHRGPSFRGDVAQLHSVDVEVQRAVVVHRVHHRHDVRPAGRTDRRESGDPLRTQELELRLAEHEHILDSTIYMAKTTPDKIDTIGAYTITRRVPLERLEGAY